MLRLNITIRRRHVYALIAALALVVAVIPVVSLAATAFEDVSEDNIFKDDIAWLKAAGVTKGCNPAEGNTKFCPTDVVDRQAMAAFMRRLAENQVVDAKTAIDADKLDGYHASAFVKADEVVTAYFSCSGTAHTAYNDTTNYDWTGSLLYGTGTDPLFRCNVEIPTGATIKSVEWSIRDTSATEQASCAVWRTDLVTSIGVENSMASANSGSAAVPGTVQISDTTITSAVVDRQNFSYFTQCRLGTSSAVGLYGVTIEYTYTPATAPFVEVQPVTPSDSSSTD